MVNISDGSFVQSTSLGTQDNIPNGIAFNNDGTKLFMIGSGSDNVNEYTLSTAFDITSITGSSVQFDVSTEEDNPFGMSFNNDGSKMYITGNSGDDVNEYALSSEFDISSSVFTQNFDLSGETTRPAGVTFNSDGTKMYIVDRKNATGASVIQYTLSTGFDISSVSGSVVTFDTGITTPHGIVFDNEGTKMFITDNNNSSVIEYNLSTGFDITTATSVSTLDVSGEDTNVTGIAFNNEGTKLFVIGTQNDNIIEYSLSSSIGYFNGYIPPDTTPPTITLVGPSTIEVPQFNNYIEYGATAVDDRDGDVTENIVITGEVDTEIAGTYIVRYNVSDSAGNDATEVTRSVVVESIKLSNVTNENGEPTLKNLNNSILETRGAVPLKDLTSDDSSFFSMGRFKYMKTKDNLVNESNKAIIMKQKKWYGNNDKSSLAATNYYNRRVDYPNNVFNINNQPISNTNNFNVNYVQHSLRRTRAGGSSVPLKVTQKNVN